MRLTDYEDAYVMKADDYNTKNLYGGGRDSGAFRDELPVLWIAAVCAWKAIRLSKIPGQKMSCI